MVYQINQKVLTLKEFGKENFVEELKWLEKEANKWDKKNSHWFTQLQDTYEQYPEWFFLFDDDVPVAFCTVQKYYEGCYRLLTRTYIYRDYRRFTHPQEDTFLSPTMRLLRHQLEYTKENWTLFVSMQAGRKRAIERFTKKLNRNSDLNWRVDNNMVQTCKAKKDPDCWQHVTYTGFKLNLNRITEDDYRKMFNRTN